MSPSANPVKLPYKVLKRRKRGREGVAKLWNVSHYLNRYCVVDVEAGFIFGLPRKFEWASQGDLDASRLVSDLRRKVEHEEAYARTA